MVTTRRKLGDWGEKLGCQFLEKRGYKILETNWQTRLGEIDIIAQDKNGHFIFVEVKTRTNQSYGPPEESINYWKQKKLAKAIEQYLLYRKKLEIAYRVDSLSVVIDWQTRQATIRHLKNIM